MAKSPKVARSPVQIEHLPTPEGVASVNLWLQAAARLPGKSLHAGIALRYAAERTGSRSVPLTNISGLRFGFDRNAKYRALDWLERAGLISVERRRGQAPFVTLLDAGGNDEGKG